MIELAELIGELRRELNTAIATGEGQAVRFELGTVDLELTIAVEKAAGANGKVKFWVAEAGADGKLTHSQTQKIKIPLKPVLVSDDYRGEVLVSGDAVLGER
ncbi:trypco2 family protein [Kitasatospora sp. NPDC096204]|uniref:trypco2 family protein n=1 Tax=Kitasatospora sp. NPDC096204 TaxID=3364094 RepID=UPI003815AD42